jgi:hypothetical protein
MPHRGVIDQRRSEPSPQTSTTTCRLAVSVVRIWPTNPEVAKFYDRLLGVLRRPAVRRGEWQLLPCDPAWEGNWTWDCFLAFAWNLPGEDRLLVTVNFAGNQSQCYVRLPFADLGKARWRLTDLMDDATYDRDGDDLQGRGLYLDMRPWQASVFSLSKRG